MSLSELNFEDVFFGCDERPLVLRTNELWRKWCGAHVDSNFPDIWVPQTIEVQVVFGNVG